MKSPLVKIWALPGFSQLFKKYAAIKWYSNKVNNSVLIQTEQQGSHAKFLCYNHKFLNWLWNRIGRKGDQIWTDAVWVRTTGECLVGKAVTQVSFFHRIRDRLLSVSFN